VVDINIQAGKAEARDSHFHIGFYRKPQVKIQQDCERIQNETKRAEKLDNAAKLRTQRLIERQSCRNVINGEGVEDSWYPSLRLKEGSTLPALEGGLYSFVSIYMCVYGF
jgi:hypothetical protein